MPVVSLSYKLLVEQQASYPPYPETANVDHFHYKCAACSKVVSVAQSVAKHKCLHCSTPLLTRDLFGNLILTKDDAPTAERELSDKSSKVVPSLQPYRSSSTKKFTSLPSSPCSSSTPSSSAASPPKASSSSSSSSTSPSAPLSPLAIKTRGVKRAVYDWSSESSGRESESESETEVPLVDLASTKEEPRASSSSRETGASARNKTENSASSITTPSLPSESYFRNPISEHENKLEGRQIQSELLLESETQLDNYTNFIPPLDRTFKALAGNMIPPYVRADTFTRVQLRPYQVTGVSWLIRNFDKGLFSIIDDPPGVGRGIQLACFLTYLYVLRNVTGPHLILATSTAAAQLWVSRLTRYCPLHSFVNLAGPNADSEATSSRLGSINIFVATPQALASFPKLFSVPFLVRVFCFGATDSLSCFGDALEKVHQVATIPFTCAILNNTTETENNHSPSEAVTYSNLISTFAHKPFTDILLSKLKLNDEEILVLRRSAEQIQDELPQLKLTALFTPASELQTERYNDILRKPGPSNYTELLHVMEQLMRICCHPDLPSGSGSRLLEDSGKFYCFHKLIDATQKKDRAVVVYSQFPDMLSVFERYARAQNIAYVRIDTNTSVSQMAALNSCTSSIPPALYIVSSLYEGPGLDLRSVYGVFVYDLVPVPLRSLLRRFNMEQAKHVYQMLGASSVEEFLWRTRSAAPSDKPWSAEELWGALRFGADAWLLNKTATDVTAQDMKSLCTSIVLPEQEYDFPLVWDTKTSEALLWEPGVEELPTRNSGTSDKDSSVMERLQMYTQEPLSHQSDCLYCGKQDPSLNCKYCTHAAHATCSKAKDTELWECGAHTCAECGMRQQKTGRVLMMCVECKQAWCEDHFPAQSVMELAQPDVRLHLVTCAHCKNGNDKAESPVIITNTMPLSASLPANKDEEPSSLPPPPSPPPPLPSSEFEEMSELPSSASASSSSPSSSASSTSSSSPSVQVSAEVVEMVRASLRGKGLQGEELDAAMVTAEKTLETLAQTDLLPTELFNAWKKQTASSSSVSSPSSKRLSSSSSRKRLSSSSSRKRLSSSSSQRSSSSRSLPPFLSSPSEEKRNSDSETDMSGIIRRAKPRLVRPFSESEESDTPSTSTVKEAYKGVQKRSRENEESLYLVDPWAPPDEKTEKRAEKEGEEDAEDEEDNKEREMERKRKREIDKEAKRKKQEELERKQKEEEEKEKLYQEKIEYAQTLSDGEEAWEAEEIQKERKGKRGSEYFVKWRGFSEEHNSWEPRSNLRNCPELISKWEDAHPKKRKKRH